MCVTNVKVLNVKLNKLRYRYQTSELSWGQS